MEKNCTTCKYIIPVEGADYGFCNCEKHLGLKADDYTVCSEYEEAVDNDLPKCKGCFMYDMIKQLEDDAYQNGFSEGCEYVTKIEELAFINEALQKQVDELKAELGCYMADQEIWLTKNDYLEKQLADLQNEYNQVLNQLLEATKPTKQKKKEIDRPAPGQLSIFEEGEV